MESKGLGSKILIQRSRTEFPFKITTICPESTKNGEMRLKPLKWQQKPSRCGKRYYQAKNESVS